MEISALAAGEAAGNKLDSNSPLEPRLKHLLLDGVEFGKNSGKFLGEGAFGKVYRAKYGGVACAIKQQNFIFDIEPRDYVYTIQNFQRECLLHSKLHHPNIVKMYGVCYHSENPDQPMKVMELVEGGTLARLLDHHIPLYVKLSILQDVSRGLHYLHAHSPPIVLRLLNTDTILLTLTAKIGGFTFTEEVDPHMEKFSHQTDPKSLLHGPSFDMFLFGYVVCLVVTQLSLGHPYKYVVDPYTNKLFVAYDIEPQQRYLDIMSQGSLKQLAVRCLDDDNVKRPSIIHVCEGIDEILNGALS